MHNNHTGQDKLRQTRSILRVQSSRKSQTKSIKHSDFLCLFRSLFVFTPVRCTHSFFYWSSIFILTISVQQSRMTVRMPRNHPRNNNLARQEQIAEDGNCLSLPGQVRTIVMTLKLLNAKPNKISDSNQAITCARSRRLITFLYAYAFVFLYIFCDTHVL